MKSKCNDHSKSDDYLATKDKENPIEPDESDGCLSHLPQILCISVFALIFFECLFDFKRVHAIYNNFIDWIRLNPYLAIVAIVLFYVF